MDAYFERVHVLYPFIHEGSFRVEYEQMWAADISVASKSETLPLAILHLVFAYGCEFVGTAQDQDIFDKAAPFVTHARKIIFSHIFKTNDLALVQALLLLCHYLQGTLDLNECWNLVGLMMRSAISIGLHLNPNEDESFTAVEREMRKRLWWGCFILDRTLSMKFGRPPSIAVRDADAVEFPLDVDDQYITNTNNTPRQPFGRPSKTAFLIHTTRLAFIIDKILAELYLGNRKGRSAKASESSRFSDTKESLVLGNIVHLDGILQNWWKTRPAHLRTESTSVDGPDFQRQRCVLQIRFVARGFHCLEESHLL